MIVAGCHKEDKINKNLEMRSKKVISLLFVLQHASFCGFGYRFRVAELSPRKATGQREKIGIAATCHNDPAGGGAQNAFGKDYREIALPAGDRYTNELGQKDSDGTVSRTMRNSTPTRQQNRGMLNRILDQGRWNRVLAVYDVAKLKKR